MRASEVNASQLSRRGSRPGRKGPKKGGGPPRSRFEAFRCLHDPDDCPKDSPEKDQDPLLGEAKNWQKSELDTLLKAPASS